MTAPAVTIVQLTGALGVLPPSGGKALAILGPADAGPLNLPAAFARPKDILTNFSAGPLVEEASYVLGQYGTPVIAVRTAATTAGSFGTIDITGVTGTSVASLDGSTHPNDDYQAQILIVAGGTIGIAGITLQYSLDGGRTMSPVQALGTANFYIIPGSGGSKVAFAAGTLVAADIIKFTCKAPNFVAADLGTALDALKNSNLPWELALFAGLIDGTIFDTVETKFASMQTAGKWRGWVGNTRLPNDAESESTYKTSLDGVFGAKTTIVGSLYAGAAKIVSNVSGRNYRRPVALATAAAEAAASQEVNIADVSRGPLPGVTITDINGNPEQHDESVNPGLDDSRFGTLKTFDGRPGVFVTRPRILSPLGSDFSIMPYRRVMNLYCETILAYLTQRLNKPVIVSKTTGFIREIDAREIEAGALALLRGVLMAKPKASDVQFTISRTDNLLSTKTMTCDGGIVPLAYPEFITITVGFVNPALHVIGI